MDSDIPNSFEVVKIDQLSIEDIREELQKRGISSKGNRRTVAKRLKDHLIHIKEEAVFPASSPDTSFSSSKDPKSRELSNKRRREKCLKVNISGIMEPAIMESYHGRKVIMEPDVLFTQQN